MKVSIPTSPPAPPRFSTSSRRSKGFIKGRTTAAELARTHDLTVAEVEQWMDDFVSQGTEALRSHPRDAQARHKLREKDLLAKIGDLTMQMEVLQIARDYPGKLPPDANS